MQMFVVALTGTACVRRRRCHLLVESFRVGVEVVYAEVVFVLARIL